MALLLLFSRGFHHRPALLAGAVLQAAKEPVKHRRELGFDVFQMEVFLVEVVMTFFAEPQQAVLFPQQASALDHQAHGTGKALR